MSLHTPLQWAQRPEFVLVTIPVTDAKDVNVKVLENSLEFSCTAGEKKYASTTPLFAEIVPEESSHVVRDSRVELKLAKKDTSAEYWPRITKDKVKNMHITIDWAKWKDEDEVDAKEDLGDFGAGGMPGMGGAGGMPGMGGEGGMGGMDMQAMLAQMQAGGMGGMGGGAGGMPDFAQGGADSDDEEEEVPPPLE